MSSFTYKDLELCLPEVEVIYTASARGEAMDISITLVLARGRGINQAGQGYGYQSISILPLLATEQEDLIRDAIEEHETDTPEQADYKRAVMADPNSDRWA